MDDKMEFEFIDWELYFGVFQDKLTRQPQSKYLQNCPFALTMKAYELEFRDRSPREALPHYKQAARLFEPFACYRLSEIYLKPNKFNEGVDFELSWFFLVKSTVLVSLFYTKDVFKGKEKLGRYIERLDGSHVNCLNLIDKFEDKSEALLLKYCFRLVMEGTSPSQKAEYYQHLLKELEVVLRKEHKPFLIGITLSLITARLALRHKPIQPLLDVLLMNGPVLCDYVEEQYALLGGLVLCSKDNILMSKVRDLGLQLLYLSDIFKFAVTDQDIYFKRIADTVFNIFCRLYDNIDKVTVLQDRVFVTYYLADLLYRQGKEEHCANVLKSLDELMTIKPQPGTEGFYQYLKGKIANSKDSFEKAAAVFQKEEQQEDNHRMTVEFYLSRISKKLGDKPASEEHLLKAYRIYRAEHENWSELTLQTTFYFRKICRVLKRLGKYPQFELPQQLLQVSFERPVSSVQNEAKLASPQPTLRCFERQRISVIRLLAKLPTSTFYYALVDNDRHAVLQQLPALNERQRNTLILQLEHKHHINATPLHRIIGYAQDEYYHQGLSYYSVQVVYPFCFMHQPTSFEDRIRQLGAVMKNFNEFFKLTDLSTLTKAYNLSGELAMVGWGASASSNADSPPASILDIPFVVECATRYNLEFLSRKLMELDSEPLYEYLTGLFVRI